MTAKCAGIDKQSPGFVAQIGNMKKEEALQAMSRAHALRHPVLVAVYTYWRQKRANRGKPLLRSLQAPTGTSDPDPFSVFRQPPSPPPCTGSVSGIHAACKHHKSHRAIPLWHH